MTHHFTTQKTIDYRRLEARQVLASFLPVAASVTAAGELILQANPTSEQTVVDIRLNEDGQIGYSEATGFRTNDADPSDDPGLDYSEFIAFPNAESVRFIGNDFADRVTSDKTIQSIMIVHGGDDFLSGIRTYGGDGNDLVYGRVRQCR